MRNRASTELVCSWLTFNTHYLLGFCCNQIEFVEVGLNGRAIPDWSALNGSLKQQKKSTLKMIILLWNALHSLFLYRVLAFTAICIRDLASRPVVRTLMLYV